MGTWFAQISCTVPWSHRTHHTRFRAQVPQQRWKVTLSKSSFILHEKGTESKKRFPVFTSHLRGIINNKIVIIGYPLFILSGSAECSAVVCSVSGFSQVERGLCGGQNYNEWTESFEASTYGRTVRNSPDDDFILVGRRQELLHWS